MDEFEIDAFILWLDLEKAKRKYPRNEEVEIRLQKKIDLLRLKSRTYVPLGQTWGAYRDTRPPLKVRRKPKPFKRIRAKQATPVQVMETGKIYNTIGECARDLGISHGNICRVLSRERKTAKGYTFMRMKKEKINE